MSEGDITQRFKKAMSFQSRKSKFMGSIQVPGDKSITHRALLFSALSERESVLHNCGTGLDNESTKKILKHLGIKIVEENGIVRITGRNLREWLPSHTPLNCENSGTTMRLLTGILAGSKNSYILVGDESLSTRPMLRVVNPLSEMGAKIETSLRGTSPLIIHGQKLTRIRYQMPIASAQVKTAILLAGLNAEGVTTVVEPTRTRDHTERMLPEWGASITKHNNTITVAGEQTLTGAEFTVPGDISSAAFFIVGAVLTRGSEIEIRNVSVNPTRIAFIEILQRMGAKIEIQNQLNLCEPVATIKAYYSPLKETTVNANEVALAIDEIPLLALAASFAEGKTKFEAVAELRVKESDRLQSIAATLNACGKDCRIEGNNLIVSGNNKIKAIEQNVILDHRIAMLQDIVNCIADQPISNNLSARVSNPEFTQTLREVFL